MGRLRSQRIRLGVVAVTAGMAALWLGSPAWAAGSVTVTPNPVLLDPAAPTTATLSLSLTAADPLPAGITSVSIQMTPEAGGLRFTNPSVDGCFVGPPTVLSCPWAPVAAGESFAVTASIEIAPGLPPQVVPVAWSVASTMSQPPVDEGSSSLALVDALPTSSPSPTASETPPPSTSSTALPVPTAVPAGQVPAGGTSAWPALLAGAVIVITGGVAVVVLRR